MKLNRLEINIVLSTLSRPSFVIKKLKRLEINMVLLTLSRPNFVIENIRDKYGVVNPF